MDDKKIQIKEAVTSVSISFDPEPVMQLIRYLKDNVAYPAGETIEGQVTVGFTTHDNGTITDIHIIESLSNATDAEALRVIKAYTQWPPRPIVEGRKPTSKHTIGINFTKEQN